MAVLEKNLDSSGPNEEGRLGDELNGSSDLLDLLLGELGDELGPDDDRLLWQVSLAQHLEVSKLGDVNDGRLAGSLGGGEPGLLSQKSPQLVQVDDRAVVVVLLLVEVAHTDLSEVSRVVLVEHDPVVVLSSGVTASTGVLPVLADTTVSVGHVSSLMPSALQTSSHLDNPSLV